MPSSFEQAYLAGKILSGSLDMNAGVLDDSIESCTFRDCVISNGSFAGSNFLKCVFENTVFKDVKLDATVFKDCVFKNFALKKCSLDMVRMEGCSGAPLVIQPS